MDVDISYAEDPMKLENVGPIWIEPFTRGIKVTGEFKIATERIQWWWPNGFGLVSKHSFFEDPINVLIKNEICDEDF